MIRTFIWGSCVSRDTFEFLGDEFVLEHYVARQSLLSAGNVVEGLERSALASAFQNRVHDGDLAGDAFELLSSMADDLDLVLLDLCDERLGVVDMGEGRYLTRSIERMRADLQDAWDARGEVLAFGSYPHLDAWAGALERTTTTLNSLGLMDRTIVVGAPWAIVDDAGDKTPSSFGLHARVANELMELYLMAMEVMGHTIVGRDIETVASVSHQWGVAPFHYDAATYRRIAAAIQAATSGRLPSAG